MKRLNTIKKRDELRCDCCRNKIPFKEMTYIENHGGRDLEVEKPIWKHGEMAKNPDGTPATEIIYFDGAWVCRRCRKDKRFDHWRIRKVEVPSLRFA